MKAIRIGFGYDVHAFANEREILRVAYLHYCELAVTVEFQHSFTSFKMRRRSLYGSAFALFILFCRFRLLLIHPLLRYQTNRRCLPPQYPKTLCRLQHFRLPQKRAEADCPFSFSEEPQRQ